MATKTYYLTETKASGVEHLLLQDGGSAPAEAVMTTGWVVSTLAPTRYAMMDSAVERAASTFLTTVLPNAGPNNTIGDCFRSLYKHKGTFAAGNWSFSLETIGISRATSTHDGLIRIKFYRSVNANGSSATDITGTIHETSGYTNLANTARQALTLTVDPGEIVLDNEYLFIQVCLKGTGAGDNAASDTHLCTGASNYITTTDYTESTTPNPKRTTNTGASVEYVDTTNYARTTDIGASVEYIDDHTDLIASTVDVGVEYSETGRTSVVYQVSDNDDDAYENQADGGVLNNTLVNIIASATPSNATIGGFRFQNVLIPQGAIITSAKLVVWAVNAGADNADANIYGEAIDNSPNFADDNDIYNRVRTTANSYWYDQAVDSSGYDTNGPTINSVIQEIVDRAGWSSGNALTILVVGNPAGSSTLQVLAKNGYANTAKLYIEYQLSDDIVVSTVGANVEYGGPVIDEYHITSGNDDASEGQDGNNYSRTLTTANATSGTSEATSHIAGFRFQNIQIPQGEEILSATISILPTNLGTDDARLYIHAEAIDNSPDFVANEDVLDRTRTTASVYWLEAALGISSHSPSPNIASVIQEVIDRPGWASGNALTVLLRGRGDFTQNLLIRTYEADPAEAAILTIQYTSSEETIVSTVGVMVEYGTGRMVIQGAEDVHLDSSQPTTNKGNEITFAIAHAITKMSALLRFDLSSIPADVPIVTATLVLTGTGSGYNGATLNLYRVLSANTGWGELTATWNTKNGSTPWAGDAGGDGGADAGCYVMGTDYSNTLMGTIVWNNTLAYRNQIALDVVEFESMRTVNDGLVIVRTDGESTQTQVWSSENTTISYWPYLVIEYTLTTEQKRVSALGTMVEYNVYAQRQVSALGTMVEYNNYAQRQITALGVMVEYSPVVAGRKWGPIVQSG